MADKKNIVVAGYSRFSLALVGELNGQIKGRLYFVTPDFDQAMEASLHQDVVAIKGEITDITVLDQLNMAECRTFVAGSREDEANVLCTLYAKNQGAEKVYARVLETKLSPLLESVGITPIQTSHTAAAFMAISILKPAVAELVSLTHGQFDLEEIDAASVPALADCQLGNLQGKQLHIIAVAKDGNIELGYNAKIEPDSKIIIIYNHSIKGRLQQELHKVADYARSVRDGEKS
ncbi:MAG: NAD-binding protein [Anaerolineae bacterium]|nr:NAD-binding protein [Anaerolineae bacterium]